MNSVPVLCSSSWGLRSNRAVRVLGGIFAALLLCLPAFPQGSGGRILGTVSDQSGGVVAGATVNVIDTERGVTRTIATDDAGAYNAPNLTPGNYTVRAEAKGFRRIERQGVGIEVGHEVRVDLTLQPGEQNQTVTVTESVPLVETTNATMGGTLENADIIDLPLNGRDYQNLLGLRPGVMLQPGGGPWTQSANGVRPDQSVWMVEGVLNANFYDGRPIINSPSPFTDGATILPVDAIQEFNLMENPKAEYGWKSGAVVNVGIKSGTNTLHGDAYAFGRYQGWDARNFFNVENPISGCPVVVSGECQQTPAQLKQFGATVGGPIKKDKLFFFGGYEGLRSFIGFDGGLTVPATGATGNPQTGMVDAIDGLVLANGLAALSPVSMKIAGCTAPTVTGGAITTPASCTGGLFPNTGSSTSFLSTFPTTNISDNGVGKLDWHPNDKNTINGMFFYGHYNGPGEDHSFTNLAFTDNAPIRAWSDTVSWVSTLSSTLVNEMRFGYDRFSFQFVNVDVNVAANGVGYPIDTGVTNPLAGGFPSVVIAGFGNGGTQVLGTAKNRPQYTTPNPYYDYQDSISVLKGKHSFKFGGEFTHIEADSAVYNIGRGLFDFGGGQAFAGSSSLEDFFAGTPSSGELQTGNPALHTTWMNIAGFAQDDWRVTPKLIINVGMRYDYNTPMRDANNLLGSFSPTQGMIQQTPSSSLWSGDHRDFEPRLGFAYDLNGKGTTVIRGGASLIHEAWTLNTFIGQFTLQNASTSISSVPTGAVLSCAALPGEPVCPATAGGTIDTGVASILPSSVCWNAGPVGNGVPGGPGCGINSTGATALPSVGSNAPKCGDGVGTNPGPCSVMGVSPGLKSPFVVNYNFGITHQFGNDMSLQVAYVGNRGFRLLSFEDINQAALGSAYCLNTLTAAQAKDACNPATTTGDFVPNVETVTGGNPQAMQEARPFFTKFPYLGVINFVANNSWSNYNSLQATFTKRMSHGLAITGGYTYGHALDTGSLNRFGVNPENSNDLAAEYGNSDFDVRHRLTATVTYNIPGRKGFGQLLEGWQINTVVTYATSQPWGAWDATDNFSGTGENTDRWNLNGSPANFTSGKNSFPLCAGFNGSLAGNTTANVTCTITNPYGGVLSGGALVPQVLSGAAATSAVNGCQADAVSGATLAEAGCYVSPNGSSFLTPPAFGTYGNMGRNAFRDSGFKDWDFSIFKNFTFKERFGVQARWEIFNVLNHPIAANPYGASSAVESGNEPGGLAPLGASFFTPDFAAGNPLIGSGSERVMQVGLKITF
jgi:hypothetical protein